MAAGARLEIVPAWPANMNNHLPPPVTPSDEEPMAAGGWYTFEDT